MSTPEPKAEAVQTADRSASEAAEKLKDHAIATLGHAVALLNNHLPRFGDSVYRPDPEEGWKQEAARTLIAAVPDQIRDPLASALVAACKYAERMFSEGA